MEIDFNNSMYYLFGAIFSGIGYLTIIGSSIYYFVKTKANLQGWLMLSGTIVFLLTKVTGSILPVLGSPSDIAWLAIISQNINSFAVLLFSIGFFMLIYKIKKE